MSRALRWAFLVLCAGFFLLPVAEMVHTSLTGNVAATTGVTGSQYTSFFRDPEWRAALGHSFELAAVVGVVGTGTGLLAAVGIASARSAVYGAVLEILAIAPVILPPTLVASALLEVSIRTRVYGTTMVALGQVVLATPWSYLLIRAGLSRLDRTYPMAAFSLGDSRLGVVLRIWFPLLGPFLLAAGALCAAVSLSDPLIPEFLGSPDYQTLAGLTWDSLQHGIDNRTAVGGTLILASIVLVSVIVLVLWRFSARTREGRATVLKE